MKEQTQRKSPQQDSTAANAAPSKGERSAPLGSLQAPPSHQPTTPPGGGGPSDGDDKGEKAPASLVSRGITLAKSLYESVAHTAYALVYTPVELFSIKESGFGSAVGLAVLAATAGASMSIATSLFNAQFAGLNYALGTAYTIGVAFFCEFALDVASSFLHSRASRNISNEMTKQVAQEIGSRRASELATKETRERVVKVTNKCESAGTLSGAFVGTVSSCVGLGIYGVFAAYQGLTPTAAWCVVGMLVPTSALVLYNIHLNRKFEEKNGDDVYRLGIINKELTNTDKSRVLQITGGMNLLRKEQGELTTKIAEANAASSKVISSLAFADAVVMGTCFTIALLNLKATAGAQAMLLTGVITSVVYRIYPLVRSLASLADFGGFLKAYRELKSEKRETNSTTGRELESPTVGLKGTEMSFSFDKKDKSDRRMLFNGASLAVKPSSFTVLFAGEGVGKSTLLDIFATVKTAESGNISILDGDQEVPLGDVNEEKWREWYLGYLPQKAPLNDGFTLRQNLLAKCGEEKADFRLLERLLVAVDRTDWTDLMDKTLGDQEVGRKMSGGEGQIISLIRTLMTRPKIVLLDEPFCELHEDTTVKLITMLRDLKSAGILEYQPTILMVTHDSRQARLAEEIAYIPRGSGTIFQGSHEHLLKTQPAYKATVTAYNEAKVEDGKRRSVPDASSVLPAVEPSNVEDFGDNKAVG